MLEHTSGTFFSWKIFNTSGLDVMEVKSLGDDTGSHYTLNLKIQRVAKRVCHTIEGYLLFFGEIKPYVKGERRPWVRNHHGMKHFEVVSSSLGGHIRRKEEHG